MTTERGVICKQGPRVLREVLWEWVSLLERTTRLWTQHDDDAAWMYNERASISIFAGAVWRMGGIAFEEFMAEKFKDKSKKSIKGSRCDLYLEILNRDFIAEAKYRKPIVSSRLGFVTVVERALRGAVADVELCKPYNYSRLGILFASPRIPLKREKDMEDLLTTWVQQTSRIEAHASAWAFPPAARKKQEKGYFYPGGSVFLILLPKVVSRR